LKNKIQHAQAALRDAGLDALFIPTQDPHASEYPADCYKLREYLSGFTGSAGELVITQTSAALFTDGRYELQAKAQLSDTGIEPRIVRSSVSAAIDYMRSSDIKNLGADFGIISSRQAEMFRSAGFSLSHFSLNNLWYARPERPRSELNYFDYGSISDKLNAVRAQMGDADAVLVSALDDIAWLLCFRARDIDYCPVAYAYCLVFKDRAELFTDGEISPELSDKFSEANVRIAKYSDASERISSLPADSILLADKASVCEEIINSAKAHIKTSESIAANLKTVKSEQEQKGFREAHILDGAALTTLIYELKTGLLTGTELDVSERLWSLRKERGCIMPSFETISAYGANSAIVHYAPTPATNAALHRRSFILLDSGGHYPCGTTDVTRTVSLGELTQEEKRVFTLVLKGHIDLARSVFPARTNGRQLDSIARTPLQQENLDFAHGTGHGVGHVLIVHEGPARISPSAPLSPIPIGTVISNEPGAYLAGRFGVRTENLMLCRPLRPGLNCFETLTLAPIDLDAVIPEMLTSEQKRWLNEYHRRVRATLTDILPPAAAAWLKNATESI
jgi:Xaa-Pro aminopeptidase